MLSILFNLPVPVAALFVDFKNLNLHDNLSKHHKVYFCAKEASTNAFTGTYITGFE